MFHQVPWRWERGGEGAQERPMQKLPTNFQEMWGHVGVIKIIKYKNIYNIIILYMIYQ